MLQLVEPPKIPRLVRSQAILREDGGHSGGRRVVKACRVVQKIQGQSEASDSSGGRKRYNPGAEEGKVELVELSKIPMIVGSKRFFRRYGLDQFEG
ncbi:hypothetical protein QL285_041833 [Trifolium repens]|nr:hypothetical protein QL285_041833 [Trifolium repens]